MNLSTYFTIHRVTITYVMLTRIGEFQENWRRKSRLFRMGADEITLLRVYRETI